MANEQQYTQEDARKALYAQITIAANDAHRIGDAGKRAGVIRDLAEAYAWVAAPSQPH